MTDLAYSNIYKQLEQSMLEGMGIKKANADDPASIRILGILSKKSG